MTQGNGVSATGLSELAAEIFDVSPDEVTPGAAFYEDLGADSLQKVEFVVRIERQFGVRLTDEEAAGLQSVADALAVLTSRGISVAP